MTFVFDDQQEDLKAWLEPRLNAREGAFDQGFALGIADGDKFLGAVVFFNGRSFANGKRICEAGIATTEKSWATRSVLRAVFTYPFKDLGVSCLRTTCDRKAKKIRAFNERLGFKYEGIGRCLLDGEKDAAVYSMLPSECKWLGT